MDKQPIGYKPGQKYFMDEKPKKNPKYQEVKGKLNTGPTVDKMVLLSENKVAKRRTEVFFRLAKEGLADLLDIEKNPESIYNIGFESQAGGFGGPDVVGFNCNDDVSSLRGGQSIQTNQTNKTIKTTKTEQYYTIEVNEKTDYTLLDLRKEEDHEKYRIKDSINFPAVLIPRDRFPNQMYHLVSFHDSRKTSPTS